MHLNSSLLYKHSLECLYICLKSVFGCMPSMNQLILSTQQRTPKKRMRNKTTPALQGSPQKRGV